MILPPVGGGARRWLWKRLRRLGDQPLTPAICNQAACGSPQQVEG